MIDDAQVATSPRRTEQFDLILSEPSNPWVSGVSGPVHRRVLRSACARTSRRDGVFGQWLHLYEIDDGLVLSVIARRAPQLPDATTSTSRPTSTSSSSRPTDPTLPEPDWSVMRGPALARDLAHFDRISDATLDNIRLVTRDALVPLIGNSDGANSDFYPTLDLLSERTRFMKSYARGFSSLNEDRFDIGAALFDRRVLPEGATTASLNISRIKAQALGARLRAGDKLDPAFIEGGDKEFREALNNLQVLRDVLASAQTPADWSFFFKLAMDVESDLHSGTMGWVHEEFYESVRRFMEAKKAPADGLAALRFMHGISSYDWKEAAAQVDALLDARAKERVWINNDLFREAASVALLHTGDVAKARRVFDRMAGYTARKPGDLRVRMVDAHIAAREKSAASMR